MTLRGGLGVDSGWRALLQGLSLSPLGLTVFRVLLGGTLLADWFTLARWYEAFFSEGGLFRRHEVLEVADVFLPFFLGGEVWNRLLFLAIGLLAFLLLLGYRPRTTAFLLALLLIALQQRNPWVWNTGHSLIPVFLLLGALLPLEAGYGLARFLLRDPAPDRVFAPTVLPFLVLLFAAYFTNSLAKDVDAYWLQGKGLWAAVESTHGKPLGVEFVRRYPEWATLLSRLTFLLQAGGAFLLIAPLWPLRLLAILGFLGFHFFTWLFLDVGNFPWVMAAALLLLLPPEVGIWLSARLRRGLPQAVVHYDGGCGFCRRVAQALVRAFMAEAELRPAEGEVRELLEARRSWVVEVEGRRYLEGEGFLGLLFASPFRSLAFLYRLPGVPRLLRFGYRWVADRRPSPEATRRWLPAPAFRPFTRLTLFLALAVSLAYGAYALNGPDNYNKAPEWLASGLDSVGLAVAWGHFAPVGPGRHEWPLVQGVTLSGAVVDPWRWLISGDPTYSEAVPRYSIERSGKEHWRKVWWGAWGKGEANALRRKGMARYLCSAWNRTHKGFDLLVSVTLYRAYANPGEGRARRLLMEHYLCM
ncbi:MULTISPECIES: HTTM domain-containing protein [Thermus]|uniref:HTTM domain-containing protein n=1 Tax=Thermus TaxID=270 RepID=UPI001F31E561|nr:MULTISPECIES: HTTM domain-containing protein [Thermus]